MAVIVDIDPGLPPIRQPGSQPSSVRETKTSRWTVPMINKSNVQHLDRGRHGWKPPLPCPDPYQTKGTYVPAEVACRTAHSVYLFLNYRTATHVTLAHRTCAAGRDNLTPVPLHHGCYRHRMTLDPCSSVLNAQKSILKVLYCGCASVTVQISNQCSFVSNAPSSSKTPRRRTCRSARGSSLDHLSGMLRGCDGWLLSIAAVIARYTMSWSMVQDLRCKLKRFASMFFVI